MEIKQTIIMMMRQSFQSKRLPILHVIILVGGSLSLIVDWTGPANVGCSEKAGLHY